jgi:hypothetical protein
VEERRPSSVLSSVEVEMSEFYSYRLKNKHELSFMRQFQTLPYNIKLLMNQEGKCRI